MLTKADAEVMLVVHATQDPEKFEYLKRHKRILTTSDGMEILKAADSFYTGKAIHPDVLIASFGQSARLMQYYGTRINYQAALEKHQATFARGELKRIAGIADNMEYQNILSTVEHSIYFDDMQNEIAHATDALRDMWDGQPREHLDLGVPFFLNDGGGFRRSEMVVVAGRPSSGKTTWCLGLIARAALSGNGVLFFSAEIEKHTAMRKMISGLCSIEEKKLERREITEIEYQKAMDYMKRITESPMWIDDTCAIDYEELLRKARLFCENKGVKVIVIDHLHTLSGNEKLPQYERIGQMVRQIKKVGRDHNAIVILLAQMNRDGEGEKPQMKHLYGSGAIEQFADIIIMLDTERTGEAIVRTTFNVVKNRNGNIGEFTANFQKYNSRFVYDSNRF